MKIPIPSTYLSHFTPQQMLIKLKSGHSDCDCCATRTYTPVFVCRYRGANTFLFMNSEEVGRFESWMKEAEKADPESRTLLRIIRATMSTGLIDKDSNVVFPDGVAWLDDMSTKTLSFEKDVMGLLCVVT